MERMRGDRTKRSKSPTVRKSHRKNVPTRRPDPGTEDFIRFVREFQVNRQPTFTGLHKKMPLPDIGQNLNLNDSGFLDKLNDEYEGFGIDNAIIYANKVSVPKNDRKIKEVLTITRQQTRDNLFINRTLKESNDNFILSRQRSNLQKPCLMAYTKQNKTVKAGRIKQSVKALPPLFQEDLPERPSAPSPCKTPNIDDSDISADDQVEFLDL